MLVDKFRKPILKILYNQLIKLGFDDIFKKKANDKKIFHS